MRATLSIVLAGLLVTTPLKQVLAQAAQQDSTTADTSLVREQRSQPIIRVPALTPETALLWQPLAENHPRIFVEPSLFDRDQDDESGNAAVIVLLLIIILVAVLTIVCKERRCSGFPR